MHEEEDVNSWKTIVMYVCKYALMLNMLLPEVLKM